MRQIITAKLKLLTTSEQHHALRQLQLAYRDALNYVSQYAFEYGKTSSQEPNRRDRRWACVNKFCLTSLGVNSVG